MKEKSLFIPLSLNFEDTVFAAVIKNCPPGAVLLASVSGGADSVAMLHALHAALAAVRDRARPPFILRCIHIEHGIRPAAESRGDAEFVRLLCKQLHIPCRIVSIKPNAIAALAKKRGIGIEAAARLYRRRAWLRCVRQLETGGGKVRLLTAHTADDMLETVLMRIFRGSGPFGLSAMPASRGRILRPLITLSRRDVLDYLAEKKLPWREDSTNADIQFLRNRIRHRLIPQLNEQFPQWRGSIAALAETQSLAAEFIRSEAARRIQWEGGHSLSTNAENFFEQPAIVREEALFQGINALRFSGKVKRANIRRFSQGKVMTVDCGSLYIRRENGEIVLSVKGKASEYGFSLLIYAPGSYNLKGIAIEVSEANGSAENGIFLASLPLVLHWDNGTAALKTMPPPTQSPAVDGKRYAVRITPKRGAIDV